MGKAKVTPVDERPRCSFQFEDGRPCPRPALWYIASDEPLNGRCKFHFHPDGSFGDMKARALATHARWVEQFGKGLGR
jgi:hypothetical protein